VAELEEDATPERAQAAAGGAELARDTWRSFEEFNIQPPLAFEALFIRLRRQLTGARAAA
jgi:hypothetical protein